ncbi:MAG TPA: methylated-DNA--[protein]-cysteine S-methyltransferase [Oculatellaceae cyanobacterium]
MLTSDGECLTGLYTGRLNEEAAPDEEWSRNDDVMPFAQAKQQLAKYFAKELEDFNLPLNLIGTDFQKSVWHQLLNIPYGTVISYGELARRLGNPKAMRAVGLANGRNPISIIVPCHRVIGADGSLTGYGGGIPRKRALLSLEGFLSQLAIS